MKNGRERRSDERSGGRREDVAGTEERTKKDTYSSDHCKRRGRERSSQIEACGQPKRT